ncbi:MAG: TolC family protein [Sterolibacterium sp.]
MGLAQNTPLNLSPIKSLSATITAALQNDPVLLGASAQLRVDAEVLPKARADLLPRLSFQASQSQNTTTSHNFSPTGARTPDDTNKYDSNTKSLSVSQALIRPRSWMGYLQGQSVINAAEATYESAIQQAIDRAVTAFMEKLRLEFEMASVSVNEASLGLRLRLVQRMVQAERASLVDLKTAEANYAQAQAHTLEISSSLISATGELSRLTGIEWTFGKSELGDIKKVGAITATVIERKLQGVVELDVEQHPEVMARKLRLEAAQWEMKKRTSDHSPTLDLVASISEGSSASDITIGRYSKTRAVGLQLNIPIYAGGAITSSVREGAALMDKAEMDLRNARMLVANDRRRSLSQIRAGVSSLRAGVDGLEASELTLRQVNIGVNTGINSEVELKDALSRKASSEATLAASVAKVVSLYSNLRLAQGTLNTDEMAELSAVLK